MCIQVTGNTFLHQQEQPDTKAQLSSSAVVLAPALPNQATYQSVMVMNHGDTALQFEVQGLSQYPHLACKPHRYRVCICTACGRHMLCVRVCVRAGDIR